MSALIASGCYSSERSPDAMKWNPGNCVSTRLAASDWHPGTGSRVLVDYFDVLRGVIRRAGEVPRAVGYGLLEN
jgi:hypothetical protein